MTEELRRVFFEVPEKPRPQVLAPAFREPNPPTPFKFQYGGFWLNIRPETRGNKVYWYIVNQIKRKRYRVYVSPAGMLTRGRIVDAANKINP